MESGKFDLFWNYQRLKSIKTYIKQLFSTQLDCFPNPPYNLQEYSRNTVHCHWFGAHSDQVIPRTIPKGWCLVNATQRKDVRLFTFGNCRVSWQFQNIVDSSRLNEGRALEWLLETQRGSLHGNTLSCIYLLTLECKKAKFDMGEIVVIQAILSSNFQSCSLFGTTSSSYC